MLYVDDVHFDKSYFERLFSRFDRHPVISRCHSERLAVRVAEPAFWIALCLYIKDRGGWVLPLPSDTPIDAARRRAKRNACGYLLFGIIGEDALQTIERVEGANDAPTAGATPALLQMSSGTTGQPKSIERSWSSIDTEVESYVRHFPAADDWTPVVAAPVTHSYGLISGVLSSFRRGKQPRIIQNLNPKYVLRKLSEAPTSLLFSSPTFIATLCLLVPDGAPLFAVMTSGSAMQNASFDRIRARIRHLLQQYGCSEAGCLTLSEDIASPSELGTALPHVSLKSGASEATPSEIIASLSPNATIATGDLGYYDDGKLHFVARLDDMINVSGFNVYPAEVEEVILEMPSVTDAVVFKQASGLGHEQVALMFVAERQLSEKQIRTWCAPRLTSHQIPSNISQVPHIPKLANGKISRRALSES